MWAGSASPCDCITAQVSGMTNGTSMAMAPQLEPVPKPVAAASRKTSVGSRKAGRVPPSIETRKSAVPRASVTSPSAHASSRMMMA